MTLHGAHIARHPVHTIASLLACLALAAPLLAQTPVPVLVGEPVDLDTGITTNLGGISAAFNTTAREYRVFWFDSRIVGENDVYAQRVGPFGARLGDNVPIAVGPVSRTDTACAYNARDNNYLATWRYQGGPPGSQGFNHTYGGLVSAAGGLITAEADLCNGGLEPSIAASGAEFLLEARNFAGGGAAGIRGQRISSAGQPIGTGITIATEGAPAPAGQIAWSPVAQRYLATWRDQVASDLKGRILNPDGSYASGPFTISTIFPGGSLAAGVAPTADGNFLAVFGLFSGGPAMGQFVSSAGAPLGAAFPIINSTSRLDPFIAYDPLHDVFLVACSDMYTGDLAVVLLRADGAVLGDPLPLTAATAVGGPSLTANPVHGGFLVAWRDSRNYPERNDVLAQIVGVGTRMRGDLNCDGAVNFSDINPFVLRLSDPQGYQTAYPYCPPANGDCNADGRVDFDDINPFVALLSGP
ncbi:MAG: hypothetical protein AB1716_03705 [Planctomycetota bacterium]